MHTPPADPSATSAEVYGVESNDPDSRLIDRSKTTPEDLAEIGALMGALGALRDSEENSPRLPSPICSSVAPTCVRCTSSS